MHLGAAHEYVSTKSKDIPVSGEIHRATFAASVILLFVHPSGALSYIYTRSRIEVGFL